MIKITTPIVSVEWLYQNLGNSDLVVLDATIPKVGTKITAFQAEVFGIPNTRFFDLKNKFSDKTNPLPNTMPNPEEFEKETRQLEINQSSVIVAYDQQGIYSSARAWWMFKSMGHENVAVLNGGYPAWKKANFPTEKIKSFNGELGNFIAKFKSEKFCDAKSVLSNLREKEHLVLDARAEARFLGMTPEPRAELRSGHIPSSKNIPYTKLQNEGSMKTKEELTELLKDKNPENKPLILSCGSGVTACVIALAAHICNFENVTVYDGSWAEWGANPEFPIE